jgi:hypothetical protein
MPRCCFFLFFSSILYLFYFFEVFIRLASHPIFLYFLEKNPYFTTSAIYLPALTFSVTPCILLTSSYSIAFCMEMKYRNVRDVD